MTLILRIENYDQLDNGGPTSVRLDGRGASVGRRANMDWVLPDPSKTISGHHFDISYGDGTYWITDVSTNGTYRHGQRYRLDGPQALSGGERFVVGNYVIGVELIAATVGGPIGAAGAGIQQQPPTESAAWDEPDAEDPWAFPAGTGVDDDPFAQPPRQSPPGAVLEDLAGGFVPIQQPGFQSPGLGPGVAPPPGGRIQSPGRDQAAGPYSVDFRGTGPIHDLPLPGREPAPPPPPIPYPNDLAIAPSPPPGPYPGPDVPGTDVSLPHPGALPQQPASPPPNTVHPQPGPHSGEVKGSAGEAALRAFCEGAGLDPSLAQRADAAMLMFALGRSMRISTEEIMRMLRSRSDMKVFTRAGTRTMVAASGNNPMKFLPEPHEALEAMFLNARPGFMEGPDAFEDALKDIRLHQEAIFRALQPALRELLSGLSPEEIEAATEGSGNLLAAGRKGKHWALFVERWDAKANAGENGVLDAFLQAFARTYAIASARDHDSD
ncbi:MAG: type VI secretion system-associated FHA domain protein TagH [Paracoccaceae bacterium]